MILLSIRSHAWEKMAGFFMISSVIFLNVFNGTLEPIATDLTENIGVWLHGKERMRR